MGPPGSALNLIRAFGASLYFFLSLQALVGEQSYKLMVKPPLNKKENLMLSIKVPLKSQASG